MQTLSVEVEDDFVAEFISYVDKFKEKVSVKKSSNLEEDPHFYERRKRLHTLRNDIKSGKEKLIPWDEFKDDMNEFEKSLELKYAD